MEYGKIRLTYNFNCWCVFRPGIEFVTSMFGCAMVYNDMKYVQLVLDVIKYEEMEVNSVFMKKIESFYNKCLKIIKVGTVQII